MIDIRILLRAIDRYRRDEELRSVDVAVLRDYLRQWIRYADVELPIVYELRNSVGSIRDRESIAVWSKLALQAGASPW